MNINRKLRNSQTACFVCVDMCASGCDSILDTYGKIRLSCSPIFMMELNVSICPGVSQRRWCLQPPAGSVASAPPEGA